MSNGISFNEKNVRFTGLCYYIKKGKNTVDKIYYQLMAPTGTKGRDLVLAGASSWN